MAYNVKFLKGSSEAYSNLALKDDYSFYYVDGSDLYLGDIKLSNAEDLVAAVARVAQNESDIKAIQAELDNLTGGESGDNSSISTLISELRTELVGMINANTSAIGAEEDRATTKEEELATSISNLEAKVDENETDIEKKVSDLIARIQTNEGNIEKNTTSVGTALSIANENKTTITTLSGDLDTLEGIVDTLVGADADKSVRAIAIEVLTEKLIAENADESLNTLEEIAAWIQSHPDDAAAMNASILALQTTTGEHTTQIASLLEQINAMKDESTGILAQSKGYTDEQIQIVQESVNGLGERVSSVENAIADINNTETGLLAQAQAKLNELKESLGTAAYKNEEDFDAAGAAAQALVDAKAYTDGALTWDDIPVVAE